MDASVKINIKQFPDEAEQIFILFTQLFFVNHTTNFDIIITY